MASDCIVSSCPCLTMFLRTVIMLASSSVSSSSSSRGMVELLTMLADRKLARDEPELALLPVDTTDMGDMQEVRPERELRPLSLELWLWLTTWSLVTGAGGHWPPTRTLSSLTPAEDILRLSILAFHHCCLLLGGILSFSEGELLAGCSGFRPSLLRLNGRLLGPRS